MMHGIFTAVVLVVLGMLALLITMIIITGRTARKREGSMQYDSDITIHRGFVTLFIILTVMLVVIIELGVRFILGPSNFKDPMFSFVHLPAAATFLSTALLMRFKMTGLYAPTWHRRLAYGIFLPSSSVAIGTGLYLLATA